MPEIYELLINAGPMGLFAGYLVWAKTQQDRKFEVMQTGFLSRLADIESRHLSTVEGLITKFEEREEKIRDRWRNVVKKVETERDDAQKEILQELRLYNAIFAELKERVGECISAGNDCRQKMQEILHRMN